jgi:hypothetical protein
MKFIVTRTTDVLTLTPPCERAELSEHQSYFGGKVWEIEINSIEELIELKKEVNHPIILCDSYNVEGMLELEIYDGYRE